MAYPLVIGGACILASILGTFAVRLGKNNNIMGALYKGFITSSVFSALFIAIVTEKMFGMSTQLQVHGSLISGLDLFVCVLTVLGVTGLLVWFTAYYTSTSYRPVRSGAAA